MLQIIPAQNEESLKNPLRGYFPAVFPVMEKLEMQVKNLRKKLCFFTDIF